MPIYNVSHEFDARDIEFKKEKIAHFQAVQLIGMYLGYFQAFNPIDDNMLETYDLLENELIKRCTLKREGDK
jgi:hypothetical protein